MLAEPPQIRLKSLQHFSLSLALVHTVLYTRHLCTQPFPHLPQPWAGWGPVPPSLVWVPRTLGSSRNFINSKGNESGPSALLRKCPLQLPRQGGRLTKRRYCQGFLFPGPQRPLVPPLHQQSGWEHSTAQRN